MSADSPRRSGSRVTRQSGGVGSTGSGQVVVPQPVTDPSIIDSVTGFINEVVPQAYTSTLPGDFKETITWARFESADINDPALFPDNTSEATLPLLLVLGYNSGVQVWSILANGEATEVLSWSQGSVRTLRILPSPVTTALHRNDSFASKRPLVALCDSAGPGPGPPFCSVSFISLKGGDQVKSIKFKNPVCDVVANRRSVVITFSERIAVFDACTLEDRLSVTSCYPSPGPNANPVALGSRWLAFAEKKLIAWQRSSGTIGGVGAQSYTATVLHAAQTLGRGLRGLSETVASSLTGPRNSIGGQVGSGLLGSSPPTLNGTDHNTPGIVTVIDLESSSSRHNGSDDSGSSSGIMGTNGDGVVAHFIAHNEALVALEFDPSGMLLLTADKRGHDFHVFRLQPHPGGSSLAAVHHLYVLHRGDTTAKVQDVAFSCDSRWVAVSTMRGTTHVFPLTPYGGPVGVRTHGSPHVVNRLSRFHRSAGLSADGRSSPVPSPESPPSLPTGPHANPRLPPYPHAAVQGPLAQLRQSPHPAIAPSGTLDISLRVCAAFAPPRAWLLDSHASHIRDGSRDSNKGSRKAVDSLFIMACHGNLVQYDLEPKPVTVVPREKVCDDTLIDLEVEARAQWLVQRSPHSPEVLPPLPSTNPLLCCTDTQMPLSELDNNSQSEERWLSQVEIVTHAGPHRRLWMGPQITFKTYTATSCGSNMSLQDVEAVEVGTVPVSRPARSNPVNMPAGARPIVPVLIESGSGSSFEQTPHLLEVYGADSGDAENWAGQGDSRLREDLADAMLESPGVPSREKGQRRCNGLLGGGGGVVGEGRVVRGGGSGPVRRVVNPGGLEITMSSDGEEPDMEQEDLPEHHWEAIAIPATAPIIPVPPIPDSIPRELVTTIAAAELIVKTSPVSGLSASSKRGGIYGRALPETTNDRDGDKRAGYDYEERREKGRNKEGGAEKHFVKSARNKEGSVEKEGSRGSRNKEGSLEKETSKGTRNKEGSFEKEMIKGSRNKEGSVDKEVSKGCRNKEGSVDKEVNKGSRNKEGSVDKEVSKGSRNKEGSVDKEVSKGSRNKEGSMEKEVSKINKGKEGSVEGEPIGRDFVKSKGSKKLVEIDMPNPDPSASSGQRTNRKNSLVQPKARELDSEGGCDSQKKRNDEQKSESFAVDSKNAKKTRITPERTANTSDEPTSHVLSQKKKKSVETIESNFSERSELNFERQSLEKQGICKAGSDTSVKKNKKKAWNMSANEDEAEHGSLIEAGHEQASTFVEAQKSQKEDPLNGCEFPFPKFRKISKTENEIVPEESLVTLTRTNKKQKSESISTVGKMKKKSCLDETAQSVEETDVVSERACDVMQSFTSPSSSKDGSKKTKVVQDTGYVDEVTEPSPKPQQNAASLEGSLLRNPKTPVLDVTEPIPKPRKKGGRNPPESECVVDDLAFPPVENRKKSLKCDVEIVSNTDEITEHVSKSTKKDAMLVQEASVTTHESVFPLDKNGMKGSLSVQGSEDGSICDLIGIKKETETVEELESTQTEIIRELSVAKNQKKRGKMILEPETLDKSEKLSKKGEKKSELDIETRKDESMIKNRKKGAKGNQEPDFDESSSSVYQDEMKYSKVLDQTDELVEESSISTCKSSKKASSRAADDATVIGSKSKKKGMKGCQEMKEQPSEDEFNTCKSFEQSLEVVSVQPVVGSNKKGKKGGAEFQDSSDSTKENDYVAFAPKSKKKSLKHDETLHDALECLADSHDSLHDAVECLGDSNDILHDAVECLQDSHETLHDAVECLVDSHRSELEDDLGDAAQDVQFYETDRKSKKHVIPSSKRQDDIEVNLVKLDTNSSISESDDNILSKGNANETGNKSVDSQPKPKSIQKSWKMDKENDASKEVDDFPALPSKKSSNTTKRAWNVSQETSARTANVWSVASGAEASMDNPDILLTNKTVAKSNEEQITSEGNPDEPSAKPKRGWELPGAVEMTSIQSKGKTSSTVSAPDVDVDKLTFEDLEAIVDAACKEEEAKTEKLCLKENKSGKKVDGSSAQNLKKVKGKENHGNEVVLDSDNSVLGASVSEKIEPPKCAEEPVKSPEKLVSTPSKGTKAQRRKGRR